MRHGSLFSGIGGFDLAAQWMGWTNVFHCEWNPFCQKVLKHHFPNSISYDDITKTDFTIHRGEIDILTGGFPCQPFSSAGKRKGTEDDRHLWPEMLRAIREIQPGYAVGENVRGITNWNGGLVFDQVQSDLEAEGFEVLPFLLPACAVNAPHRRDRIWFIANTTRSSGKRQQQSQSQSRKFGGQDSGNIATDANGRRFAGEEYGQAQPAQFTETGISNNWENFPTQRPICSGNDGLPDRLDGISFPKWRNESIKGFGNAIVPQVAIEIFKAIEQLSK